MTGECVAVMLLRPRTLSRDTVVAESVKRSGQCTPVWSCWSTSTSTRGETPRNARSVVAQEHSVERESKNEVSERMGDGGERRKDTVREMVSSKVPVHHALVLDDTFDVLLLDKPGGKRTETTSSQPNATIAHQTRLDQREKKRHILVNLLLDLRRVERAAVLRETDRLGHQLWRRDGLAALHDAHDRRLRFVLPVAADVLVRGRVLFFRLPELDLVDLDAVLGVGEADVDREAVRRGHFAPLGFLLEDLVSGAGQRLEGATHLGLG